MLPPAPTIAPLRLASPKDILRIGVVAASGFRYSPWFSWDRPYHEKYPEDTLLSYRKECSDALKSPEHIVLVALDKYDPNEGKKTDAIIPPSNGAETPSDGEEVIVGAGCWKLESGSHRKGSFQNDTGTYPDLPENKNRDQNVNHVNRFSNTLQAAEHKYFSGYATMEWVVVHPAYWNRGHGTTLVKWGMQLANTDQVKQGVIAAKTGTKLYRQLGYNHLSDLHLDGDDEVPDGVTATVMEVAPTTIGRMSDL